LPSSS